jgi:transcriptional regulator with XRE-family HTH domain
MKGGSSMNQKNIGSFLKTLRKEKNLTQEQLAEQFNVSSRTVSRWETGSNMPDLSLLVELADFYNVDIREIIDGERKSEIMNSEEKETLKLQLAKVKDACKIMNHQLVKRLRIISIVGLCSIIVGFVMLNLGTENNMPVYDYLMGTSFGLAMGALIVAVFYSTGVLSYLRKNIKCRNSMKVIKIIAILACAAFLAASIVASL